MDRFNPGAVVDKSAGITIIRAHLVLPCPKMSQDKEQNQAETMLIQEALAGEEEAFIQLYHQHVSPLYRFIFSKVNNQQDAEDIASETFYQALRNLKSFSGKSTFKNWLYGIAKHLILAKYRERYNESTFELDENAAFEELKTDDGSREHDQKVQFLDRVLAALPRNYRDVLELRFLKGYTIIETARALGITEQNAKVLQHRALKKANQLSADGNIQA